MFDLIEETWTEDRWCQMCFTTTEHTTDGIEASCGSCGNVVSDIEDDYGEESFP